MARLQAKAKQIGGLIKETFVQWEDDQASRLAASLALYTLLSIAPLIVVSIAVAGVFFGDAAARGQLIHQVAGVVGEQAGRAIEALIDNARAPSAGIIGSVVGIAVLLFGASGVFGELQVALNQIWNVKQRSGRGWRGLLRDRFFSFTMVMGVAFLLLVSLIVSAVLTTVTTHFENFLPWPVLWEVLNALVGLAVSTLLFAQILFLGAEFAQVYATRFGTRIEPTKNAVLAAESKGNDEGSGAWRVSKSSS